MVLENPRDPEPLRVNWRRTALLNVSVPIPTRVNWRALLLENARLQETLCVTVVPPGIPIPTSSDHAESSFHVDVGCGGYQTP